MSLTMFGRIVVPGSVVGYELEVEAENYLSDLLNTGIGQVTYRNIRAIPTKSHLQVYRFPRNSTFEGMRAFVADASEENQIGAEIQATLLEEALEFRVDLDSSGGNAGTDMIEFRLR